MNSRIAFMFIDATLFLCSSDTIAEPPTYLDYKAEKCTDPKWQAWGDTQNKWINKTLEEWDQDGSIIYRVLVNHYPIWTVGVNYKPSDFAGLNNELLPILRLEKFDLYLSAHGVTSFANIKPEDSIEEKPQPEFESLLQKAETWFNFAK